MSTNAVRATDARKSSRGYAHTTGEAARLAGVSASTVRTWEREGLVQSRRADSGYRYFNYEAIKRLRRIAFLRKYEKLNIAGIARVLIEDNQELESRKRRQNGSLGARLRICRLKQGLTIAEAATLIGLSASFLSALERDQTGASIATLHKVARAYGSTLSHLLRTEVGGLVQVKRPPLPSQIDQRGVRMEQLVDGTTLMDASITSLDPGATSGGAYAHEGEELVFVLEGTLKLTIEQRPFTLSAGQSIYYPSSLEHSWENPGQTLMRCLWVCTPSTF
jgi:DNA-binding transcriptional MerR regulator/quercetin dioxygenase-like cupin family protein